ncbi:hypothetical protein [Galbibacter pacificus]|uniref:Uncharacterized protein n=1 Tax=Galbibacter pacificus TaxID=2996052 RepID=A0ABT6FPS1_9FLAO|nr:hypothetical protein [Galbibacter pacificus]MDG3582304.1 hypothetical protein [Galbibacter pacificus]MDG3585220.1 hypothetical protein [Galbibacter pacificus]
MGPGALNKGDVPFSDMSIGYLNILLGPPKGASNHLWVGCCILPVGGRGFKERGHTPFQHAPLPIPGDTWRLSARAMRHV